jgi:hypothetical protein
MDLPPSSFYDSIWVVVDQLTKMDHFILCTKTITDKRTTNLFLDHIFRYHGFPEYIILLWTPVCVQVLEEVFWAFRHEGEVVVNPFHPQTNGQTKWVNQVLEQYLQCTTNYHQNNWSKLLLLVEFVYNNIIHSSTQQTPLFANHGLHPKFDQVWLWQQNIKIMKLLKNLDYERLGPFTIVKKSMSWPSSLNFFIPWKFIMCFMFPC